MGVYRGSDRSGVAPFENLLFKTITDDEIKIFDNIRQGNDFGC